MERPILFSANMIKAILDGTKNQTRRLLKPQPIVSDNQVIFEPAKGDFWVGVYNGHFSGHSSSRFKCPYGQIDDVLWVKETFYELNKVHYPDLPHKVLEDKVIFYSASFDRSTGALKKKPSLFMPKIASRIELKIKSVRVERLNDISESDAVSEGVEIIKTPTGLPNGYKDYSDKMLTNPTAKVSYETLWEKINGKNSWSLNPFVFVIDFDAFF